MEVGFKIVCDDIDPNELHKQTIIGTDTENGHLVVRSSANEQLLYLDGATDGKSPIFIGLSKSRGDQTNKLPVEAGDTLGGFQVYARTKPGNSLGYCHSESPLTGAIQFFVADDYNKQGAVATEMIIALSDNDDMSARLKLDSKGNLITHGNITSGNLTITDNTIDSWHIGLVEKYVEVEYDGKKFAMPLYKIENE